MSIICIIPARGGSKRIPRKNVRDFCGKPMIAWSIEAALGTGLFSRVVVSTDSDEIAAVSVQAKAEVPFMRPSDLADEVTGTIPVIRHAINRLESSGIDFEYVCCLYATAPFVQAAVLKACFETLAAQPAKKFAFPITTFAFPIQRGVYCNEDGSVKMIWPENEEMRSQDLREAFHDAGQFYWGRRDAFMEESSLFCDHSIGYPLPRYLVQDIDTEEDWIRAELMFEVLKRNG